MDDTNETGVKVDMADSVAGSSASTHTQETTITSPDAMVVSSPTFEQEQKDIARILEETKIPDRPSVVISGEKAKTETAPHTFDTALGVHKSVIQMSPSVQDIATQEKTYIPTQSSVVPVHTLKDDLQEVVRDKKISVVRAAALEADKKRDRKTDVGPQPSGRVRGMVFGIILFILLGSSALGAVWYIQTSRTSTQDETQVSSILFSEQTFSFMIGSQAQDGEPPSARELKSRIAANKNGTGLPLGAIARIVPTVNTFEPDGSTHTRPATTQEFLSAISAGAPDELSRALSENFFFGIHTVDKNAAVFVFEVASYEHAFAGMLAWERGVNTGLSPIVPLAPSVFVSESGTTTQNEFFDLVMRNYDVRALRDGSGAVVLYYSFPTRNILVLAESPYSFAEVLARLRASRRL